jgi:hypothetical protein
MILKLFISTKTLYLSLLCNLNILQCLYLYLMQRVNITLFISLYFTKRNIFYKVIVKTLHCYFQFFNHFSFVLSIGVYVIYPTVQREKLLVIPCEAWLLEWGWRVEAKKRDETNWRSLSCFHGTMPREKKKTKCTASWVFTF